jgi:polyhydroxybutyrate depolymerase
MFRTQRHAASIALAVSVAACAGTPASPRAATTQPSSPPATAARSPIEAPSPPRTELREPVVTVGGDARRIKVYLPDPAPAGTVPLVVFLHPAGGSPSAAVGITHFDQLAGRAGFIAAFPPADHRTWDVVTSPGLIETAVDEAFLEGMIDQLTHDLPVDPSRVYVAGFSMGAVMTDRLSCSLSGRIAAAAIVSGTPWAGLTCSPTRPVSVLVMHGTADAIFPFDAAQSLAARWRAVDGCPPPGSPVPIDDTASLASSAGCADGTSVAFIAVEGGPHAWFESPDATAIAWQFFVDHGRR